CKQIGLSIMMYQQDYDEVLIPWYTRTSLPLNPSASDPYVRNAYRVIWTQLIQPYIKNTGVLYCPSFNESVLKANASRPECDGDHILSWFPIRFYYAHYGIAFDTGAWGGCTAADPRNHFPGNSGASTTWKSLAQIARPGETAIVQDNFTGERAANDGVGTA